MHPFQVGKPYHAGRKVWTECSQLHWMSGELELTLFIDSPSRHEVEAVRKGRSEFALYDRDDLVVLLYTFDGPRARIPWSDASYQWHLVPADRRVAPPENLTPNSRAILHVVLVNATGGLIEAMRQVTLSPEFTVGLFAAIHRQIKAPWPGRPTYDAQIAELYRRYPNSADMLPACVVRGPGGGDALTDHWSIEMTAYEIDVVDDEFAGWVDAHGNVCGGYPGDLMGPRGSWTYHEAVVVAERLTALGWSVIIVRSGREYS